jgi:hypothetical protein
MHKASLGSRPSTGWVYRVPLGVHVEPGAVWAYSLHTGASRILCLSANMSCDIDILHGACRCRWLTCATGGTRSILRCAVTATEAHRCLCGMELSWQLGHDSAVALPATASRILEGVRAIQAVSISDCRWPAGCGVERFTEIPPGVRLCPASGWVPSTGCLHRALLPRCDAASSEALAGCTIFTAAIAQLLLLSALLCAYALLAVKAQWAEWFSRGLHPGKHYLEVPVEPLQGICPAVVSTLEAAEAAFAGAEMSFPQSYPISERHACCLV